MSEIKKSRNSSIELLKIIAIFLIVIGHVVQSLYVSNDFVGSQEYIINISCATNNVQYLLLAIFRYFGPFGNIVFFICSAWFLLDSNTVNKRKILQMLVDIFAVSVIILVIVYFLQSGNIGTTMIVKQFFPTFFENNWFMTCYLLFYPVHPFLNSVIKKMNQKTLLRTIIIMLFLYVFSAYIFGSSKFFFSEILLWVTIYFAIAYMKYYLVDLSNSIRANLIAFGVGFTGNIAIVLLTNFVGLKFELTGISLLRWSADYSPFLILMSVALLNMARNIDFKNKVINYISGLTMFIYIIHENILLRTYYRPLLWQRVYENFGYDHIVLWTFIIAALVFVFALLASILYKCTINKFTIWLNKKIYPKLSSGYGKIEKTLLKLH